MELAKKIALFDSDENPVKVFDTLAEAQKYCKENRICNTGWVARSLEIGEKFYNSDNGPTKSHNDQYQGFNWYVQRVITIKE